MISLAEYINEAKLNGVENVDMKFINSLSKINNDNIAEKLLDELSKLDNKDVETSLKFIDILNQPKSVIATYRAYHGDKKNEKLLLKIKKSVNNILTKHPDWLIKCVDMLFFYYFSKISDKKPVKSMYADKYVDAVLYRYDEYFKDDISSAGLGKLGDWYEKCKDFCTSGSFRYAKNVKSIKDFDGLTDDCDKYLTSKNIKTQSDHIRYNLTELVKSGNTEEAIKLIEHNNSMFDPYVVNYDQNYKKNPLTFIIEMNLLLELYNFDKKHTKPLEWFLDASPSSIISYLDKN